MGTLTSIQLLNASSSLFEKPSESDAFITDKALSASQLYPVLKPVIEAQTRYRLVMRNEDEIEVIEQVDEDASVDERMNSYTLSSSKNGLVIHADFYDDILRKLLSLLSLKGHPVTLQWQGDHPFYTAETIENYQSGDYQYAGISNLVDMSGYIETLITNFADYEDYWCLSLFVEGYAYISFDNNTAEPDDGLYNLDVYYPAFMLDALEAVNAISANGSVFCRNMALNEAVSALQAIFDELDNHDIGYCVHCFEPVLHPYYEITAKIDAVEGGVLCLEDIVDYIREPDLSTSISKGVGRVFKVDVVNQTEDSAQLDILQAREPVGMGFSIDNQDLREGHVYLDKFYDEPLITLLAHTIAKHFCPCFISVGEDIIEEGIDIFYRESARIPMIEKYFAEQMRQSDIQMDIRYVRV